jgi:heat shock protein HspQ
MTEHKTKFLVGQIVHHKLFGYIGAVFDIDPFFQSSDEWYEYVARSRPPKNKPWYHVLVHTVEHTTYVAEQNLELEEYPTAIEHPLTSTLFSKFDGSQYQRNFEPLFL